MINIKRGPTIEKYASIYVQSLDYDLDEAVDEVLEWVNCYINGPWNEAVKPFLEATEKERADYIKTYVKAQVDNSTTGRIKCQLKDAPHAGS